MSTIRLLVTLAVGVTIAGQPLAHSVIQPLPIIDVHLHAYSVKFLTEEQRRDIFYNNARRFLRLASDGRLGPKAAWPAIGPKGPEELTLGGLDPVKAPGMRAGAA